MTLAYLDCVSGASGDMLLGALLAAGASRDAVDDAFAKLPKEDLEVLGTEEGRPELIAILRRHIAVGAITREDLDEALDANGGAIQLASVADQPIDIRKVDGEVRIGSGDDAPKLTKLAVPASNGVVYVIDGMIPPGN